MFTTKPPDSFLEKDLETRIESLLKTLTSEQCMEFLRILCLSNLGSPNERLKILLSGIDQLFLKFMSGWKDSTSILETKAGLPPDWDKLGTSPAGIIQLRKNDSE